MDMTPVLILLSGPVLFVAGILLYDLLAERQHQRDERQRSA